LNAPPGGESTPVLIERVLEALAKLATERDPSERLLVVTHGGVIRALEMHSGLQPRGVPVLSGRWFGLDEAKLLPGDAVAVGDME
ncbi:MAG: histidine phosphatase family protein, partial [Actinomycetota bacterium]|nr:histidine phosphatase family protein [Actinomycetota bacterium]